MRDPGMTGVMTPSPQGKIGLDFAFLQHSNERQLE